MQPVFDYSVQVLFVAVVITVVLPVFLLPAVVISAGFALIGRLYLRNALAARKEVSAARSPLFSTLGDSTAGVTTIRAFGRSDIFATRYKQQTDNYNKVMRCAQRTCELRLTMHLLQMQLCEEGLDRWLELRADMTGALVSFVIGLLCISSGLSSGITGFLISTGTFLDLEFELQATSALTTSHRSRIYVEDPIRRQGYQQERAQPQFGAAYHTVLDRGRDGGGVDREESAARILA